MVGVVEHSWQRGNVEILNMQNQFLLLLQQRGMEKYDEVLENLIFKPHRGISNCDFNWLWAFMSLLLLYSWEYENSVRWDSDSALFNVTHHDKCQIDENSWILCCVGVSKVISVYCVNSEGKKENATEIKKMKINDKISNWFCGWCKIHIQIWENSEKFSSSWFWHGKAKTHSCPKKLNP